MQNVSILILPSRIAIDTECFKTKLYYYLSFLIVFKFTFTLVPYFIKHLKNYSLIGLYYNLTDTKIHSKCLTKTFRALESCIHIAINLEMQF